MKIKQVKQIGAVAVIGALLMLVTACALEGEAASVAPGAGDSAGTDPQAPAHYGGFGPPQGASVSDSPAIWVSGEGSVSIEPELAVLDLGVEVIKDTVAGARDDAATAMDAVMKALKANGVEDKDIQTSNFDIRPRYEWREVVENGTRSSRDVLVGYRVSNQLSTKVRDLDDVSAVIDAVITAGGDAIRFRNLRFTVEDTSPYVDKLREDAVNDAKAKAKSFADLSGMTLGRVIYLAESGAGSQRDVAFPVSAVRLESAAFDTAISGGELEVSLSIQVAFAIW